MMGTDNLSRACHGSLTPAAFHTPSFSRADDAHWIRAKRRVGALLSGKWQIDKLIGVGGTGDVYAATHRNRNRVAIKVIHPELSNRPEIAPRFLREGYVANTVGHPGAVTIFDDGITDDGCVFLVMELLHGEGLDSRMQQLGRLELLEVLAMAEQVLDVLSAAHDRGVIHRDIKPCNIFRRTDGAYKVLDFGIAHLWDEPTKQGSSDTQMSVIMGTPWFMPSEQALGRWREVDGRTDLWALGATMRFLLSGVRLHHAPSVQESLVLAATCPVAPVNSCLPELPKSVAYLLDKSLAFRREDRWRNARSMQCAVRQVMGQLGATPSSFPPSAFPANPCDCPEEGPIPAEDATPTLRLQAVSNKRPHWRAAGAIGLITIIGIFALAGMASSSTLPAQRGRIAENSPSSKVMVPSPDPVAKSDSRMELAPAGANERGTTSVYDLPVESNSPAPPRQVDARSVYDLPIANSVSPTSLAPLTTPASKLASIPSRSSVRPAGLGASSVTTASGAQDDDPPSTPKITQADPFARRR